MPWKWKAKQSEVPTISNLSRRSEAKERGRRIKEHEHEEYEMTLVPEADAAVDP